jgi:integrase
MMSDLRKRRRKGTGTIEASSDGKYRPRIATPAGRKRLGVYESKAEADEILQGARAVLAEESQIDGLTLALWGARVLDQRERSGYRASKTDRSRWRSHVSRASIASLIVRSIREADVLEWLAGMKSKRAADRRGQRRLSRQTVQNALNLLREVLEEAVQSGIRADNPARNVRVRMPSDSTSEPWTWLELWEQDAIYTCEAIPLHARLWMAFAWGTGLREGEQFNLRLDDLVLTGRSPHIIVRRGSAKHGPKDTRAQHGGRSKIRRVPLFGIAEEALSRWLDMLPRYCPQNPLGLVFPGPTGARKAPGKQLHVTRREGADRRPVGRNPMPEYLELAGITPERRHDGRHVRWHDLRHTCAASLVSGLWGRAWRQEEIRSLLGHSSIKAVERYAHLADSALQEAARETRWTGGAGRAATSGSHKPMISPREIPDSANTSESQSHLRDLNPRPTVYETRGIRRDSEELDADSARARAYRAGASARSKADVEARERAGDLLRRVAGRKAEK